MEATIAVNPLRLDETGHQMAALKTDLMRTMEEIEILILSVNGAWQGDAERAFAEKILYVKRQFAEIASFFDDYAALLKGIAYDYERVDNELASKFNLI